MTTSNEKTLDQLIGSISITPEQDNSFPCIDCEKVIIPNCENCNGTGMIQGNGADDPADIIERRDWIYGI